MDPIFFLVFFLYPILFLLGVISYCVTNRYVDDACQRPKYQPPLQKEPLGFLGVFKHPYFVPLLAGLGMVGLYHWEVTCQMLLPAGLDAEPGATVTLRFFVHALLLFLLLAATLTDLDAMIIPDSLTVPGTAWGLVFVALSPQTHLPSMETRLEILQTHSTTKPGTVELVFSTVTASHAVPLNVYSPNTHQPLWPDGSKAELSKASSAPVNAAGYAPWVMIGLWLFWCFAMLDRVWYARLPFRKAKKIFCRYLYRSPTTPWYLGAAVLGPTIVFAGTMFWPPLSSPIHQLGLLSALVGMATGMSLIWGVRLVGSWVLGREAMGFGDVTLMGMVGTFVGWQTCLLIFFLAPMLGLVLILVGQLFQQKSNETEQGSEFPFGPALCLATALIVIGWGRVWTVTSIYFELGWQLIAVIMLLCLVLLAVLLGLWRWIRGKIVGPGV